MREYKITIENLHTGEKEVISAEAFMLGHKEVEGGDSVHSHFGGIIEDMFFLYGALSPEGFIKDKTGNAWLAEKSIESFLRVEKLRKSGADLNADSTRRAMMEFAMFLSDIEAAVVDKSLKDTLGGSGAKVLKLNKDDLPPEVLKFFMDKSKELSGKTGVSIEDLLRTPSPKGSDDVATKPRAQSKVDVDDVVKEMLKKMFNKNLED